MTRTTNTRAGLPLATALVLATGCSGPAPAPVTELTNERAAECDEKAALLLRFAPEMYASAGQPDVYPMGVSEFVSGAELRGSPSALSDVNSEVLATWSDRVGDGETQAAYLFVPDLDTRLSAACSRAGWDLAERGETPVYGRVVGGLPAGSAAARLQYFVLFIANRAHLPLGLGDHVGDWLCVELKVRRDDDRGWRLDGAVVHCHGWQMEVAGERLVTNATGHPVFWLEDGTNELWPFPGDGFSVCGPTGVHSNAPALAGLVVRPHDRSDHRFLPARVVMVDPRGCHDGDPEARALVQFRGRWGQSADSPRSPRWQPKMWERAYAFPGSDGNAQQTAHE